MLNLALFDTGINLDKELRGSFYPQRIKFSYFRKISDLYEYLNKNVLDLIFISGNGNLKKEIQLTENLKSDPTLSLIPLVLYHPCPAKKIVIQGLGKGVDEFLFGEWQKDLFSAKLKSVIRRSQRDIGVNPSTHLPGTSIIEKEINRRIQEGEEFALCYADLDDFKAYNDYYGYLYGDKLIHLTSQLIKEIVYRYCQDAFVGHIGGDDFIFILPAEIVDKVCSEVVRTFDKKVITRYKARDLKRGYILTHNRKNKLERFPILTLSISVEINRNRMFKHTGEILRMLNDLKKYTKTLPGSKYIIERRKNLSR
ncbi:MAG: diguanylate cyclase [candidate division Zixibacteria bacterium]|nr:diguanylate cyclase [candidate division Zixibacteria bacterium]